MWIVLMGLGFAQGPAITMGQPTEVAYPIKETPSKRFADDRKASGNIFAMGKPLRVIVREKGWVRVRDGDTYGWLPDAAVSATPPAPPPVEITLPE